MKRAPSLPLEPIKYLSDYQRNWAGLIPAIKRDRYHVESTSTLSIHGDAPKCFLLVKESTPGKHIRWKVNWTKFIAKVGSKWYPVESITEQIITRIGQCFGFDVADSRLCNVGRQVRFLSRYFLRGQESLTHGIEIFREELGHEMVEEIADKRLEREFYTFSTVLDSIHRAYPIEQDEIIPAFIKMLLFDAIIGNNDRHPANWGVITSAKQSIRSRFSPIFDTARGLFWNMDEQGVRTRLNDPKSLESYVQRSKPLIGWDGEKELDHFTLIQRIIQNYPEYKSIIAGAISHLDLEKCANMVNGEFGHLLSEERLHLIDRCLGLRITKLRSLVIG